MTKWTLLPAMGLRQRPIYIYILKKNLNEETKMKEKQHGLYVLLYVPRTRLRAWPSSDSIYLYLHCHCTSETEDLLNQDHHPCESIWNPLFPFCRGTGSLHFLLYLCSFQDTFSYVICTNAGTLLSHCRSDIFTPECDLQDALTPTKPTHIPHFHPTHLLYSRPWITRLQWMCWTALNLLTRVMQSTAVFMLKIQRYTSA